VRCAEGLGSGTRGPVLLITQAFVVVVQPLPSTTFGALLFLASYLGLAATAHWVEPMRRAKTSAA